MSIIIDEIKN